MKQGLNKHEWTAELDSVLEESVIRNYFNFDTICMELNIQTKKLKLDFGADHQFTAAKCRLRWSYIHLKRKQKRPIKYTDYKKQVQDEPMMQSESKNDKENTPL